MTAKATLVDKVRKLDSSSQTVDKTIKINFTFKAKDTTLKNNTKTLSIEVKLTKELAFKLSSLEGTWEEINDANPDTFTIDGQGKISGSIDGKTANITIENWDATKEVTQVTVTQNIPSQSSGDTDLIFTFKDGNSCTVQVKGSQGITPKNFTKKATAK